MVQGPINFLFNLWQEAQLALNKDLPLDISNSWAEILIEVEKRNNKLRVQNLTTLLLIKKWQKCLNKVGFLASNNLKNCIKIRWQKYNRRMILETLYRS